MGLVLPTGFWNSFSFLMNNFFDFFSKYILTQKRPFTSTLKRLFIPFIQILGFVGVTLLLILGMGWVSEDVKESILFDVLGLVVLAIFSVFQALNFLLVLKFLKEANNFIEKQKEKPLSHIFREIYSNKTLTLKAIKLSLPTHFIPFLAFAFFLYLYYLFGDSLPIYVDRDLSGQIRRQIISIALLLLVALFPSLIMALLTFCFILSLSSLISDEKSNEFKLYKETLRSLLSANGIKFLLASLISFLIVGFIANIILALLFILLVLLSLFFGLIVGFLQLNFGGIYEGLYKVAFVLYFGVSLFIFYLVYLSYLYPFSLLLAKRGTRKK